MALHVGTLRPGFTNGPKFVKLRSNSTKINEKIN
jgi:hypothetical protein